MISEQHPRSLLILDDVWSKEVAQCFAVCCRTMVTSRKSTVANSVTTLHVYTVSVSEGTVCGGEGGREGGGKIPHFVCMHGDISGCYLTCFHKRSVNPIIILHCNIYPS